MTARPLSLLLAATVLVALGAAAHAAGSYPPRVAAEHELRRLRSESGAPAADIAARAEAEVAGGRIQRAAELYAQARQAAPRNGFVDRRQCELLLSLGRWEEAVRACNQAMQDGASVPDLRAMVAVMMSGPGTPTVEDVLHATMSAESAVRLLPGLPWGHAAL